MKPVFVNAVGLAAPGMDSWTEGRAFLANDVPYQGGGPPRFQVGSLLPANERRRITPTIKLALQVAAEASGNTGLDPQRMATVFATSTGDIDLIDRICGTLTLPGRPVSPTHFHNSVYNAPSGYWAIARGSRMPSSTISASDASFTAGLMEAAAQTLMDDVPVLLVAYDAASPEPIGRRSRCTQSFACALALSGVRLAARDAALCLQSVSGEAEDGMHDPRLEALRTAAPAARGLPLLGALAAGRAARVILPYVCGQQLAVSLNQS